MRTVTPIQTVEASVYRIPTEDPEADGTLTWDATTLVAVHATAGGRTGFGYTYGAGAAARLVRDTLAERIVGQDAFDVTGGWIAMRRAVRNLGSAGVSATAISAVDAALWDLKAKLLDLPLVSLLGAARPRVMAYGSGGFVNLADRMLQAQLGWFVELGLGAVKMKVGLLGDRDVERVHLARSAVGPATQLMVDANGAYDRKRALALASAFAESGVVWLEEPVSSDDLSGLHLLRDQGPPGMSVAAGEYGFDLPYFRRMLEAEAVDVLQADATRCLGLTGFRGASHLCEAFGVPLSAHCAPSLHLHVACACEPLVHVEYFYDHVRIEERLFEGFVRPANGQLEPDRSRPGIGVELKEIDATRYAA